MSEHKEQETYMVVINHEEQYSIWSAEKTIPAGWHAEGKKGQRDECLQHIEKVWVDHLAHIIDRPWAKKADCIVMGCTEIPLIAPECTSLALISITEVLAQAVIKRCYRR